MCVFTVDSLRNDTMGGESDGRRMTAPVWKGFARFII